MDNETRQYGTEPGRGRPRPQQYFPDPNQQQQQQPYYEPQPEYQPEYQDYQYQPEYQPAEDRGTSAGAIALGVLAAISFVSAVVLFFLWRGAAAEADKPPVTHTSTVTTTQKETSTVTTTKFPSIFDRNEPSATLLPDEPLPTEIEIPREFRDDVTDFLDQLRQGADQFLQEQPQ